jgi:hypothetical protein
MSTPNFTQTATELLNLQCQLIDLNKIEKQQYISIVLEHTDAQVKLNKLKLLLLELQCQKEDQPQFNVTKLINDVVNHFTTQQINIITDMLKHVTEPSVTQQKLRQDLSDVIRATNIDDEQKIDRITNLLL